MNTNLAEALVLAGQIAKNVESIGEETVVLCPPAIFLYPIYEYLKAKPRHLHLGLQNAGWEEEGEFTGEISLGMARGICRFVIVGHSERRRLFLESDEMVNRKVKFALKNNFKPIICVGETERFHLEDHYQSEIEKMRRQGGILTQIKLALKDVPKSALDEVIIAYEPVWAIGTGNVASGAYAAAISYIIKNYLGELFGDKIADSAKVLYGGSVNASDVREFMLQPSLDGVLVGGASIKSREFIKICQISAEVKSGRAI